jgi:hypothetical protein
MDHLLPQTLPRTAFNTLILNILFYDRFTAVNVLFIISQCIQMMSLMLGWSMYHHMLNLTCTYMMCWYMISFWVGRCDPECSDDHATVCCLHSVLASGTYLGHFRHLEVTHLILPIYI